MLFVFEYPHQPCFWMKNTYLPLSIAFITAQGSISSMHDMQPKSTDTHCPSEPILYALEMNQGWFEKNGLRVGDKIRSEEHTSELQSRGHLVCRLLLHKK